MDTTTDLKALARLLAEKEYPDDCGNSNGHYPSKECITIRLTHERAILPFLELLVDGKKYQGHLPGCEWMKVSNSSWSKEHGTTINYMGCTCELEAHLDKINAILDQH